MTWARRVRPWLPLLAPCLIYAALCLAGVTTSNLGALAQDPSHSLTHELGRPEGIRGDEYMTETTIDLGWLTSGGHGATDPLSVPPNYFAQLPSGPISSVVFFDGTVQRLGPWLPDAVLFAAHWWLPTLLLVLGLPTWFRQVTGSRRWGWAATALIWFAPTNQWWSGRPVNTLGFMFAAAALLIDAYGRWDRGRRLVAGAEMLGAAVLIARFPSYYQPFAIVLGFPVLVGTAAFLMRKRGGWRTWAWTVGGTATTSAVLTAGTMWENLGAIRSGLATVYPGQRIASGAPVTFGQVFGATVLAPLEKIQSTIVNTNASEASSAFTVLLLVALIVRLSTRWAGGPGTQLNWCTWAGFGLLWLSWCTVNYGALGYHLPLLNLVPPGRAAQVCGFLAIIVFCLLMAHVDHLRWRSATAATSAVVVGVVSYLAGMSWRTHGLPGLGTTGILVSSMAAAVLVGAAVRWPKRAAPVVALCLGAAALTALVNPVVVGLGDLRASSTSQAMIAAGRQARGDGTLWASDTPTFDALMFATGTPALSSRQQIGPDVAAWRRLDPMQDHQDVWNRGGSYIRFSWNDSSTIQWSNPTPDQIVMSVSPCALASLEPRLRRVVSSTRLRLGCLVPAQQLMWEGHLQHVYRVRPGHQ